MQKNIATPPKKISGKGLVQVEVERLAFEDEIGKQWWFGHVWLVWVVAPNSSIDA